MWTYSSASLSLRLSHMDTDRQTKGEDEGEHHVLPEWLSRSVVFQPTDAIWKTPSPQRVQTHHVRCPFFQLYLYASSSVSFDFPLACLSPFTSPCLSVSSVCLYSPLLQLVIHYFFSFLLNMLLSLTNGHCRLLRAEILCGNIPISNNLQTKCYTMT